jgi:hypothetical protein
MRRPSAPVTVVLCRSSNVMPNDSHSPRNAGKASVSSRRSNSWLPGTKITGTGQPANCRSPAQVLSTSPASTSSSASGAGSASNASVSRCRSESS